MGLNVNYSLLIEGNNSTSSIPKYTRYYTPGFIAESEFEACISEFNQEIRESRRFLISICEAEYVNEASISVNIVNGIKFVTEKVKKAVRLWDKKSNEPPIIISINDTILVFSSCVIS